MTLFCKVVYYTYMEGHTLSKMSEFSHQTLKMIQLPPIAGTQLIHQFQPLPFWGGEAEYGARPPQRSTRSGAKPVQNVCVEKDFVGFDVNLKWTMSTFTSPFQ